MADNLAPCPSSQCCKQVLGSIYENFATLSQKIDMIAKAVGVTDSEIAAVRTMAQITSTSVATTQPEVKPVKLVGSQKRKASTASLVSQQQRSAARTPPRTPASLLAAAVPVTSQEQQPQTPNELVQEFTLAALINNTKSISELSELGLGDDTQLIEALRSISSSVEMTTSTETTHLTTGSEIRAPTLTTNSGWSVTTADSVLAPKKRRTLEQRHANLSPTESIENDKTLAVGDHKQPGSFQCCHCNVTQSTAWRRVGPESKIACNACGLYYKYHQTFRPLSLLNRPSLCRQRRKKSTASPELIKSPALNTVTLTTTSATNLFA